MTDDAGDRAEVRPVSSEDLDVPEHLNPDAPGTLVRVSHGSRSTWHHSVRFNGYEHDTACGQTAACEAVESVDLDLDSWRSLDDRTCCDECAGSVRALLDDSDGLHEKYEVYENGEPVDDCFVLEPTTDSAARAALITYAEETDDETLAQDLRDWVVDICSRGDADAV